MNELMKEIGLKNRVLFEKIEEDIKFNYQLIKELQSRLRILEQLNDGKGYASKKFLNEKKIDSNYFYKTKKVKLNDY